jgi:hypothetical protein
MTRITSDAARRIALGAQGLARRPTAGGRDRRHFRRLFDRIGLLQLDSVNVVARSHYLPALARLGRYPREALDRYTSHSGEVFEYWGHEASLLPVAVYPLLRWRMDEFTPWGRIRKVMEDHPGYIEDVYQEIAERGPLTVGELSDPGARTGPWWGHGRGRSAVDWLFAGGRITATRDHRFGRVYDLSERVIPSDLREADPLPAVEAQRRLLELAARHHGIGTVADLADYYRLHVPTARALLGELAAEGRLEVVDVAGWRGPVYLHPQAAQPRRIEGAALLSPFDPLVWRRERAERLFGFHYRIEIYVPQQLRVHGYYVMPFLLDGRLVARVDLKAHRRTGVLEVRGAHAEQGVDRVAVAQALAGSLAELAAWLDLDDLVVRRRGDLGGPLAAVAG